MHAMTHFTGKKHGLLATQFLQSRSPDEIYEKVSATRGLVGMRLEDTVGQELYYPFSFRLGLLDDVPAPCLSNRLTENIMG